MTIKIMPIAVKVHRDDMAWGAEGGKEKMPG